MPVTILDQRKALVLIYLQQGIVAMPAAHPVHDLVQRADLCSTHFMPRTRPWCWSMSPVSHLGSTSRRQAQVGCPRIVLAGAATSIGVESTARQAHELGYNVTFAIDAMTDRSLDAHSNSVERIFPRLGETGSTQAIMALL